MKIGMRRTRPHATHLEAANIFDKQKSFPTIAYLDHKFMAKEKLSDVFKTVGQPTITYVKRANGRLETQLNNALNERGVLCLITGPSKTGKTTLYREVLQHRNEIPLIVRCDKSKTCDGIWKQALKSVEFDRLELKTINKAKKTSGELELTPKLGWAWLAEISAKIKGSVGYERSENEARRRVLAEPGPELLIPLLKETNCTLVIEDFHYLDELQKILIFQQWKQFIDNEVSVILLGTTHRAVDIANSNKDLLGRIVQVDVGHWEHKDLERISELGFDHLEVKAAKSVRSLIAVEAAGLPIIVQQTCLALLTAEGVEHSEK